MIKVISQRTHKARKDRICDACEWINEVGIFEYNYTFSQLKAFAKAKKNNFKIKVGQTYVKQVCVSGGDFWEFNAIPEVFDIIKQTQGELDRMSNF